MLQVNPKWQRGITMIEVLVTLLVLSVGVLGFAGLQMRALGATNDSFYRGQAIIIAQDLKERYRLNPGQQTYYITSSSWGGTNTPGTCEGSTTCTALNIAKYDISTVSNVAATMLPGGLIKMMACPSTTGMNCIFVAWGSTTPTAGSGTTDCVSSAGAYNTGANCLMMEAY